MKLRTCAVVLVWLVALPAVTPRAAAQNGAIEFVARGTPSGGLEEPVRGFPFYVLTKSFRAIGDEAEAAEPKPEMDAFIDKLDVSKELKAWMMKHHRTSLTGEDFTHLLQTDDIMKVPEFYQAYTERVAGDKTVKLPKPKFKLSDKTKDPAKYERLSAEYADSIHHFIEQNPQTIEGIDINIEGIDPGRAWIALQSKRNADVRLRTLDLAQSKYLIARVETDLQGQGSLPDVPAGHYWLSNLDVAAEVGDARLRWDVPLTVRAGQATQVTLSNVNAVQSLHSSP